MTFGYLDPCGDTELPQNSIVLNYSLYSAATKTVTAVGLFSPCVYVELY